MLINTLPSYIHRLSDSGLTKCFLVVDVHGHHFFPNKHHGNILPTFLPHVVNTPKLCCLSNRKVDPPNVMSICLAPKKTILEFYTT